MTKTRETKTIKTVGSFSVVIRETLFGRWKVRVLNAEGRSVNAIQPTYAYTTARRKARELAADLRAGRCRVLTTDGWRRLADL